MRSDSNASLKGEVGQNGRLDPSTCTSGSMMLTGLSLYIGPTGGDNNGKNG